MTGTHKKQLRLGELLVQQGVASHDQIDIALLEQKKSKEKIGTPRSGSCHRDPGSLSVDGSGDHHRSAS